MLQINIRKLGLCSLLGALLLSGMVFAQQEKRDQSQSGQVATAPVELEEIAGGDNNELRVASGAATFGSTFTVQVDHGYCKTGGVQCFNPGVEPGDLNRNPVRLGLQLVVGGVPVNTLTDVTVDVLNSFVPAGGSAINQIACGTCFQSAGNGMYAIFVAPGVGQTWKPGSYFAQVRATSNGVTYRALAQIEIPFP